MSRSKAEDGEGRLSCLARNEPQGSGDESRQPAVAGTPGPVQIKPGAAASVGAHQAVPEPWPSAHRSPDQDGRAFVATTLANTRPCGAPRAETDMTDRPRRPLLHLKAGTAPAAKTPPPGKWRCKPCGGVVELDADLADEAEVRCGSCGAVLGRAGQFRSDPPQLQRIRARRIGG